MVSSRKRATAVCDQDLCKNVMFNTHGEVPLQRLPCDKKIGEWDVGESSPSYL